MSCWKNAWFENYFESSLEIELNDRRVLLMMRFSIGIKGVLMVVEESALIKSVQEIIQKNGLRETFSNNLEWILRFVDRFYLF